MLKKVYFLLGLIFIHNYCLSMENDTISKFPVVVSLIVVNSQDSSVLLGKLTESVKIGLDKNEKELYAAPAMFLKDTDKGIPGCIERLVNAMGMQAFHLDNAYTSTLHSSNEFNKPGKIQRVVLGYSTNHFIGVPTVSSQLSHEIESFEWVNQKDLNKKYGSSVNTNEQLYDIINRYK